MWLLIITLISAALFYAHIRLKKIYSYWTDRGVAQGNPVYILGDISDILFRKKSPPDLTNQFYNINKNDRYVGTYQFFSPVLVLRDPELIKQIALKDYEYFMNHRSFASPEVDPLFGNNLLGMKGQEWKDMRAAVSPTFTGSKMKQIFSTMAKNGDQFVDFFLENDEKVIKLEMKDIFKKFAHDVIANTVFGMEIDSLRNPDNEFFAMVQEAMDFTTLRKMLVFFGQVFCPQILKLFHITICGDKCDNFFMNVVKENIKYREKNNVVRNDMINLLLETRKNRAHQEDSSVPDTGFATTKEHSLENNPKTKKYITDADIASQTVVFFFAGFDSVSTLLCFMAHELAVNPEIQDRLRKEIDEVNEQCDGKLTYELITTMKYMDMVVTETLRKYPTNIATDRECAKPYTIQPTNPKEQPIHFKIGDTVVLPIFGIHRDSKYWPDPEKFDPERFSDENKSKIKPYTYFPFGLGPRNCIGSRFALMETKVLFYKLLLKFEIVPIEETQIPIKFNSKAITMAAEKGFWLAFKKRE